MVKNPEVIPHTPGVYFFRKGQIPLYIGKAGNLKKRLVSYFRKNVSAKVMELREEATSLDWIEVSSEIEALIREALFIKEHLPKYNILMRDDKNYFYVGITREEFPKIFVTHQSQQQGQITNNKSQITKSKRKATTYYLQPTTYVGPFTSGSALRATLRILRRIFPYCTCFTPHKRPCLNSQIGRCPGFCCSKSQNQELGIRNHEEYKKNIKNITAVLSGKRTRLLTQLKKEMREAVKKQEFEKAAELRDSVAGLENVFEHKGVIEEAQINHRHSRTFAGHRARWTKIEQTIQTILNSDTPITRVEGYDISNISGTSATGSMVVFINGLPEKSEYRKFKIKTIHQPSDVDMHREVMRRRLGHPEWPYPELMVIDGGKPQLNAVEKALQESGIRNQELGMKIVGLAKREEELYIEGRNVPVRLDSLPPDVMFFFQHVRDESHRFAKKYHHKLREISYKTRM